MMDDRNLLFGRGFAQVINSPVPFQNDLGSFSNGLFFYHILPHHHAIGKFSDRNSGEPLDKGARIRTTSNKSVCTAFACTTRHNKAQQVTSYYCKLCAAAQSGGPTQAALCVCCERQCFANHISFGLPRK